MIKKSFHLHSGRQAFPIEETGRWVSEPPRSEIVLIGARDGIDGEALQRCFQR